VEIFGEYALNMSSDFLNVSYDVHVVITRKWSLGLLVLPGAPPCLVVVMAMQYVLSHLNLLDMTQPPP
jgi:hypothetical protein